MKSKILLRPIISIFFLLSLLIANNTQTITILDSNNILGEADIFKKDQYYLSINDFGEIIDNGSFINQKTEKIVIYIDNLKIKFSYNIPFVVIDENIYQMESKVVKKDEEYYMPIDSFFKILSIHGSNKHSIDYNKMSITFKTENKKSKIPVVSPDLKAEKNKWKFNTIIIDPGHGGKDPGAIGYRGTREKDIALDVAKRLERKISKNMKVKTILTRDEDIFLKLGERTRFANENNGDLFISIHANAAEDRRASGFETFLIGPNRNQAAVRVAARENAVLELEGGATKKLTDEALITATIAQAGFASFSEQFAALVQEEIGKRIQSKNRGVKQAGFYVLMGASMPNVLIELGFISNPSEEKKLKSPKYRDTLATSIYRAIEKYEKTLDAN
ncbi:MAG: N-acetylmuramoyl-L-alanine amidase [Candidatus Neomarinimicrobiota bacterium]|nr:MAG: N-acetylmuramoyl-L-alanine amidase [bacterium]